eukprot:TRINITY_DN6266_c0_g1_i1.p1 TRINITY_DN6266_c0_g1~~TRINITY_DN6266_c0_g1_i1.p1  ORF type:complete len:148 (+),score=24.63 TRINITY_DN6266_c0_g1_i1:601-1044(+)
MPRLIRLWKFKKISWNKTWRLADVAFGVLISSVTSLVCGAVSDAYVADADYYPSILILIADVIGSIGVGLQSGASLATPPPVPNEPLPPRDPLQDDIEEVSLIVQAGSLILSIIADGQLTADFKNSLLLNTDKPQYALSKGGGGGGI